MKERESIMKQEIMNQLTQYIGTEILRQPNRSIQPNEALLSSGLIDSFHLIDLALFVEDKFGVRIDDSELNASIFDTIEQLVTLIQSRQL
jgi:acyl carrier protein